MTTSYKVHLSNEVTLVGREDDRLHFQLRTVDASYVDATMNLIAGKYFKKQKIKKKN